MKKSKGFTLIELLVVVAIIALLIAILLPSLGKARENARTTVCGTHMKQIATANLMYVDQNNNNMITSGIISTAYPTQYPNGQFWASDLASLGYLPTKNNLNPAGGTTTVAPNGNSLFYCPDGMMTENPTDNGSTTLTGNSPRSDVNKYYIKHLAGTPAAGTVIVFSWYGLNSHNIGSGNRVGYSPTSSGGACPFVQWNTGAGSSGETLFTPGGYTRRLPMITASQKMVLCLETSNESWDSVNTALINVGTATTSHALRLAGRHGDALNNGLDGLTNFSYFDGHVAKESTVPYSKSLPGTPHANSDAYWSDRSGAFIYPVNPDTYFYIQTQQ